MSEYALALQKLYNLSRRYEFVWCNIYTPSQNSGLTVRMPCSRCKLQTSLAGKLFLSFSNGVITVLSLYETDSPTVTITTHGAQTAASVLLPSNGNPLQVDLYFSDAAR